MITAENIDHWFELHPARDDETRAKYAQLRAAGKILALKILELTPPSADQSAALRQVREAVFSATAAIACEGR